MSICRAWLRNTSNALMFWMSGKQIHFQVPPKLFWDNSWIAQMIRQRIPDCWFGNRKCTGHKSSAVNSRNWQLHTLQRRHLFSDIFFCDLHRHRRCMFHGRCTRPSATVPSPLPLQKSGTRFRRRSRHCHHWRLSSVHWRRNCSVDHTATHTTGNSTIDTSETRDIQQPWSFV